MKRSPLKRKKPMKRGGRLNPVSKKRRKEYPLYCERKAAHLEANPRCFKCGAQASDLHHLKGRAGALYVDAQWFMSLCRPCHSWVHENPAQAKKEGFLL